MKARRNDPCPCRSGKKYKNCHGRAGASRRLPLLVILGLVVVVGGIVAGKTFLAADEGPAGPTGPPPPGKVWSLEHGHWHDAPTSTPTRTVSRDLTPQPPGDPPPGKEWSMEHGHWHDIADSGAVAAGDSAAADSVP